MADLELGLIIERLISSSLLFLLTLTLTRLCPSRQQNTQRQVASEIVPVLAPVHKPRRTLIVLVAIALAGCWIADAGVIAFRGVVEKLWEPGEGLWKGEELAVVLNFLTWTGIVGIGSWKENWDREIWTSTLLKLIVLLAGASEIATLALLSIALHVFSLTSHMPLHLMLGPALHIALSLLRLLMLISLIAVLSLPTPYVTRLVPNIPSERTNLLATQAVDGSVEDMDEDEPSQNGYGTISPSGRATPSGNSDNLATETNGKANDDTPETAKTATEEEQPLSWTKIAKKVWTLVPYLWPARVWYLQVSAVLCILVLLFGRAVNVLMPATLAQLIDALTTGTSPWSPLLRFVILEFLQSGVLYDIQNALWMPVMQYSERELSFLSFDHLMNLSLSFHNKSKLGETTRNMNRGAAVAGLFDMVVQWVLPSMLDMIIGVPYILFFFGADIAAVLALVMCMYGVLSALMTRWKTPMRRQMNDQDTITRGIHTDSLINYETVKYFVGEEHESQRFRESVKKYQILEYRATLAGYLTEFLQKVVTTLAMILGSFIIVRRITLGQATPGTFIVFITYIGHVTGPLMGLGWMYRYLNDMLVDAEKLIELLNEKIEVLDKEGAQELVVENGVIEFENVSFTYDDRKGMAAIRNVSFTVPKGKHVALVGQTGSGKSTLMRLLLRFYDLKEGQGRILVDGKDLRDVTQKSLRRNLGVVPQDSVLFNQTIGFNIGYGKLGATQEEIEASARAAQMHDRIMSLPDEYETTVGERGVKLSGGEKQRVAIARMLLKDPPILLLDEATSALDTGTERDIQKALNNLVKGRSSLTIAHRLSTIANADIILVMKDGEIIERGSHRELLQQNGVFAQMWAEHIMARGETETDPTLLSTSTGTPIGGSTAPSIRGGVEGCQMGDAPASAKDNATKGPATGTAAAPGEGSGREGDTAGPPHARSQTEDEEATSTAAPTLAKSGNAAGAAEEVVSDKGISSSVEATARPGPDAPIAFPRSTADALSIGASEPNNITLAQSTSTSSPPWRTTTPKPGMEPMQTTLSSKNVGRAVKRISIGSTKGSGSESGDEGMRSPVDGGMDKKTGKK